MTVSAKKEFVNALKADPQHVPSLYSLGIIFMKNGDNKVAASKFKAILEIDSKNYDAHYNMGLLYYKDEKYDDAITEHKEALDKKKDNAEHLLQPGTRLL